HVLDLGAGGELGTTGGCLQDAVAARLSESPKGSIDGDRRRDVDRRVGEAALLGTIQHRCVRLRSCEGHGSGPSTCVTVARPQGPGGWATRLTGDAGARIRQLVGLSLISW